MKHRGENKRVLITEGEEEARTTKERHPETGNTPSLVSQYASTDTYTNM